MGHVYLFVFFVGIYLIYLLINHFKKAYFKLNLTSIGLLNFVFLLTQPALVLLILGTVIYLLILNIFFINF